MIRRASARTALLVTTSPRLDPARVKLHENDFDDRAHYEITPTAYATLKRAAKEVHDMALSCVEQALTSDCSDRILDELCVPQSQRDVMRASWRRGDRGLFGRMDFAWDARASSSSEWTPKFLEYNADTPGNLYETAVMQPEYGFMIGRKTAADEFKHHVVQALKQRNFAQPVGVFYHPGDPYIATLGNFVAELFEEAGYQPVHRLQYPEMNRVRCESAYKIFRWHAIWADKFPPVRTVVEEMMSSQRVVVEPPWKYLMQHKGLMALMWRNYPNHPFLLPTFLEGPTNIPNVQADGYVIKSFHGVRGGEVKVISPHINNKGVDGEDSIMQSPCIYQQYVHLPLYDGRVPVVSTWVVNDEYAGALIRDDTHRITIDDYGVPLILADSDDEVNQHQQQKQGQEAKVLSA
jgi:glutathionylspermidine synthase